MDPESIRRSIMTPAEKFITQTGVMDSGFASFARAPE
jgi:hypothetical protein